MTTPAAAPTSPRPAGQHRLLEELMRLVRVEFRHDRIVPVRGDPILGGAKCSIDGCPRPAQARDLCRGHRHRWTKAGKPDLDTYRSTTDPVTKGRGGLRACVVAGCQRGIARAGLCHSHFGRWHTAGRPDQAAWSLDQPLILAQAGPRECQVSSCGLLVEGNQPFCYGHYRRWLGTGRGPIEDFIRYVDEFAIDPIDLRPLSPQLRLEWQYLVQCRVDEQRHRLNIQDLNRTICFVAASGVISTLDRPAEEWQSRFNEAMGWKDRSRLEAMFTFAARHLGDLADPPGWDNEFPRDVWQLRRLGFPTTTRQMRFDRIPQPWLRELAKRYTKYRLSIGLSTVHVTRDLAAIDDLAAALPTRDAGPQHLTRTALEHWLGELHASGRPPKKFAGDMSSVATFLRAVRRFDWEPQLPPSADLHREDFPKQPEYAARYLPDRVMAQIELPDNLARFTDNDCRLITLIMIRSGIRVGGAVALELNCLTYDGDAPYLRYMNSKMKREAYVPIGPDTADLIKAQQQAVLEHFPTGRPCLFPGRSGNPDGSRHLSDATYRTQLYAWLAKVDIRDDVGRPLKMTPHQWRHTFGTRLNEQGCPQEVIQRLLDHGSPQMTAHYARTKDKRVRQEWEKARKVGADGQVVTLDPAHPLNDAMWANNRLGRATMALPNGYCGLPLTQTCETANQCLDCPMFLTTKEFLPQHRQQRSDTARLIATAEGNGQFRMVQTNTTVLDKLDRIISTLQDDDSEDAVEVSRQPEETTVDAG